MIPTIEILENINKNSEKNKDEVFTRLYRYMLRLDIYYVAYKNLYANSGAATKGVDNDTIDGFCERRIKSIIQSLTDETYSPKPGRRTYIKKANGKMRPLGIPTFTDKLVQEVLRMILEAVYEPVFLECSHGFRPNRSCHTALEKIKYSFNGIKWFVEGDIKSCFDTINHSKLIEFINVKIKDARLIKLIWKLLKAGYVENWEHHRTHSGTPQGGICSPIFANIYLHELDKFVTKLSADYDKPRQQVMNKDYGKIRWKVVCINREIENAESERRRELIKLKKTLRKEQLKLPFKNQTDKKMRYIRYADDFIIGICGSKEDCQSIKQQLSEFVCDKMGMELSDEKTLITHSNEYARFLGYDIRVRRNNTIKRGGVNNCTKRTLNHKVDLAIPLSDKIMKFLFDNKIVKQKQNGEIVPTQRLELISRTDFGIITAFNTELRGLCNYYSLASNFYKLKYFSYLMEYSCLLTLCAKYNSTIGKIMAKYRDYRGKWCIPYKTKMGIKYCYFADFRECKTNRNTSGIEIDCTIIRQPSRTTFESRLENKICELCKTTKSEHYEIHHVPKLKDLRGIERWENVMIAKRRKTLIVCENCHNIIHNR